MRELKRFTPETHESYGHVCAAQGTIDREVLRINENNRVAEQLQQLTEVQARLDFSDLAAPVNIVHTGRCGAPPPARLGAAATP